MAVLSWVNYLQLLASCLSPAIIAIILHYFLKKWKWFKARNYWIQQVSIGLVFSLLALCSFYFGVDYSTVSPAEYYKDVVGNFGSANASPLIAGLVFGGPAGFISGFTAGIYRLFIYPFGSGDYLRAAECITVFLAGGVSWILRITLFDDKKPKWYYGLIIGIFIETIHMILIFICGMSQQDSTFAYGVIRSCDIPCMLTVGLSITLTLLGIAIVEKEKLVGKVRNDKRIATKIQKWFALTFIISLTATFLFTYLGNYSKAKYEATDTLQTHCNDVDRQVKNNTNITNPTEIVLKDNDKDSKDYIKEHCIETYHSLRYHRINLEGVCCLLDGTEQNKFRILSYNVEFDEYYKKEDAYLGNLFHFSDEKIVGEKGYHYMDEYNEKSVNKVYLRLNGVVYSYYMYYQKIQTEDGRSFYVLSMIYVYEAKLNMGMTIRLTVYLELLIFIIIFGVIYTFIKKVVVSNVHKINASLDKITGGNLNVRVNVRSNQEFSDLSDDINQTVDTLKHFIEEANKRIDNELNYAKQIQQSSLPVIFPSTSAYDLHATMNTAKQVGGDFYDFFPVGESHLFFLIADVSGKGIPAAMFMMRAKTLVKSLAQTNELTLDQIIGEVNNELNVDNKSGMFVTAWFGLLNIHTGVLEFVNAGHCRPLVGKAKSYKYINMQSNFVLGVFPDAKFKLEKLRLKSDEGIILYTDGVTEADNKKKQLYGEDRLLKFVNKLSKDTSKNILEFINKDVNDFERGSSQADDITMLMLRYNPKKIKH